MFTERLQSFDLILDHTDVFSLYPVLSVVASHTLFFLPYTALCCGAFYFSKVLTLAILTALHFLEASI